jgi:hypothetical protein
MPGHSRPKDGVLSHAYVAGIHVLGPRNTEDVDGRNKPGHDEREALTFHRHFRLYAQASESTPSFERLWHPRLGVSEH